MNWEAFKGDLRKIMLIRKWKNDYLFFHFRMISFSRDITEDAFATGRGDHACQGYAHAPDARDQDGHAVHAVGRADMACRGLHPGEHTERGVRAGRLPQR